MLLWRFTFLTGLTHFFRNFGPDRICRSKFFSPVDGRKMWLYSPDIWTILFPLLCLQLKGAFRLQGARFVAYCCWLTIQRNGEYPVMIRMMLNKMGSELGWIREKVVTVDVKLLSANGKRTDRKWTDVSNRQAKASSLNKFTLHLSVKYINARANYNRYIIASFIHTEMATTKLIEMSRNIHASKPPNGENRTNTRKQKIL